MVSLLSLLLLLLLTGCCCQGVCCQVVANKLGWVLGTEQKLTLSGGDGGCYCLVASLELKQMLAAWE